MKTRNIITCLLLFIASLSAHAASERIYTLSRMQINNVNHKERYIVKINYNTGSGISLTPSGDIKFQGFADNAGQVKSVTANGSTLYIEFLRRKTPAAINGSVSIYFNARPSTGSDDMLFYTLPLAYSYPGMTGIDPGAISAPSRFHLKGEKPDRINSVYAAMSLAGGITYTWEKRTSGGDWETVEGATLEFLYPDPVGETSDCYRRRATDSAGNTACTEIAEILPLPDAGEISMSYSDSGSTIALSNVRMPNITEGTISWQSSTDLENWTQLAGNLSNTTAAKPTVTTYYRRSVTAHTSDTYDTPITIYSNTVCYSKDTPAGISTMTYWSADSCTTDNTYFDGLGRRMQSVSKGAAMDGKDIITAHLYDNRGREIGITLPFCHSGSGEFARNAAYKNSTFHGDNHAITRTVYESSPLDRPIAAYKPGDTYQGAASPHSISTEYGVNAENEVIMLSSTPAGFATDGFHPAATLYRTHVTDEDGATLITFTDNRGKNILERRAIGEGVFADTYYIYDSKHRLTAVVSPEGSAKLTANTQYNNSSTLAKEYCYIYSYDSEDRLTMKRLPGRCAEFYEYDTEGRPTIYYDEEMQKSGLKKLIAYDTLDRVVGFRYESDKGACCQQRYYYNDYSAPGVTSFRAVDGIVTASDLASSVKGKLTHERTFELYSEWASEARERTYYYDKCGRCVQTITDYSMYASCRTSVKYDYAGNPLKTLEEYSNVGERLDILTECTFDNRGRKLTERTSVNGTEVGCAAFTYDEQGRVTKTRLGNRINITAAYNLQGWLTATEAVTSGDGITADAILFNTALHYYDTQDSIATPRYSGKITEQLWRRGTEAPGVGSMFVHGYDAMGRLTSTKHRTTMQGNGSTAGIYGEQIAYDKNGNILSHDANIDGVSHRLNYTYNGNHMASVAKNDIATGTAEYDSRGNITKIPGKNLQLAYNISNLPQSITAADGTKVNYSYFSDGSKFRAVSDNGEKLETI